MNPPDGAGHDRHAPPRSQAMIMGSAAGRFDVNGVLARPESVADIGDGNALR
jgi:hypothetical protein